jgi:hypothetical protein
MMLWCLRGVTSAAIACSIEKEGDGYRLTVRRVRVTDRIRACCGAVRQQEPARSRRIAAAQVIVVTKCPRYQLH